MAKKSAKPSFLGIEIGGTKLQIVLGDATAKILQAHHLTVDRDGGAPGIRRQIETTLGKILPTIPKFTAVGVGFGGPVDWRTGKIYRSHQIEGWSDFDLAAWLKKLTRVPVFVDNDANVAALGEAIHGAGQKFTPVFYVTLGSGVGGGLVVDGRIYHGATPGEAEIGHLRLDRAGTIVESRCSGWAVDAKIRALRGNAGQASSQGGILQPRLDYDSPSPGGEGRGEGGLISPVRKDSPRASQPSGGEARLLVSALAQNNPTAQRILRETAEDLAFALSHVVHLFHPQVIVIGGGLANVGEPLRAAISDALTPFVMEAFQPCPPIRLTKLSENAVPIGALQLAIQQKTTGAEK